MHALRSSIQSPDGITLIEPQIVIKAVVILVIYISIIIVFIIIQVKDAVTNYSVFAYIGYITM